MSKHEESKAVAIAAPQRANPLATVDADIANFLEQQSGAGLENIRREDTSIPFLGILQDLSPQVKKQEAQYIQDAEVGMLCDFSTRTIFDGKIGIVVIPLLFEKVYNVWKNRKAGGGFLGSFKTKEEAEKRALEAANNPDATKRVARESIDIVDTGLHYLLYQVPASGQWRTALLSCKSTMLKRSRGWNLQMQTLELPRAKGVGTFVPPSFGTMYMLTTTLERKDNNSYFNFSTEFVGLVTDGELLAKAVATYKSLKGGEISADFAAAQDVADAVGGGESFVDTNTKKF